MIYLELPLLCVLRMEQIDVHSDAIFYVTEREVLS